MDCLTTYVGYHCYTAYITMGKFLLKRPRIISKKFPRVDSHIDGVTKSLEGLVFAYSREVDKALQKKRLLLLLSSLVLIMVLGSFISPKGKADSAIFYPHSCLGGWINPGNAEGKQETTANTDESQFTLRNSAVLPTNTQADMYCGNFAGDIEKNTRPTKILVSFAWTKGENVTLEQKIESNSFASSSQEILDSNSQTDVSFTLSSTTESTSTQPSDSLSESTSTEASSVASSVVETVVSAVNALIDSIFEDTSNNAPETQSPPETKPVEQLVPETSNTNTTPSPDVTSPPQVPEQLPSEQPVSLLETIVHRLAMNIIRPVYAEEGTSTETLATSTSSVEEEKQVVASTTDIVVTDATTSDLISASSTIEIAATSSSTSTDDVVIDPESDDMATNNFLEVLYTFDGVTWNSLGKVNEISMKYRTFEIPVMATTSWNDLGKLQIKIERLSRTDETPTVYLDGIQVEVLYEAAVWHDHPDFARDTLLKDKSDDGVRVLSIINSDSNNREIWYTTIDSQGEYGVAPGSWVQVNLDQTSPSSRLVEIYGRNIFWVDEDQKLLWVTNLQKETNDGIGLVIGATTTVPFTKTNGEEWLFDYNEKTKVGIARIKK